MTIETVDNRRMNYTRSGNRSYLFGRFLEGGGMKPVIVAIASVILSGCASGSTGDDRWKVKRHIDTPAGQAEMARSKAEAEARSAAGARQSGDRKAREARMVACEERNRNRQHSARLYGHEKYKFESCD
jgi:hypothetical protein